MQVACPSCSAQYPVDERRLPASGLKMRCPKCGARFHVHTDGRVDAVAPLAGAVKAPRPGAPSIPKPGPAAPLDLDMDLPAPKRAAPLGAFGSAKKEKPTPAGDDGLDLPALKSAPARPAAGSSPKPRPKVAPPVGGLDLDLPAPRPKAAAKAEAPLDLDLDLPAVKAPSPPARPHRPAAPRPEAHRPTPPRPGAAPAEPRRKVQPYGATVPAFPTPAPPPGKPAETPRAPIAPPVESDLDLDLDLDLPAAKPRSARSAQDDLDLDLPAPKKRARIAPPIDRATPSEADLPAPKLADDGLDLPMAKPRREDDFSDLDLDLPTVSARPAPARSALADEGRTPFDDLDLPQPKGSAADVDLPARKRISVIEEADEAFGDLDLPMPKATGASTGFGDLDLPKPKPAAGGFGEIDLPTPKHGGFGEIDLPTPRAEVDLPTPAAGFGDLDLPAPRSDPPLADGAGFGDLDLPTPRGISDLPRAADSADLPIARGTSDLPVAKDAGFDDLALPEPRRVVPASPDEPRDRAGRPGGTAFGELDLGAPGDADDMEFADIPQEAPRAPIEAVEAPPREVEMPAPRVVATKKPKPPRPPRAPGQGRRGLWIAASILALLVAAGGALGLTPYGFFGMYYFDRFLPGAGDPAQVAATIRTAEEEASTDRWVDLRRSLITLGAARRHSGLNRALLARSLVHESLYAVRFRDPFGTTQRASAIVARLEERGIEGPDLALARAADALRQGQLPAARTALAEARRHDADDPYVDLVAGELELAADDPAAAREAFERAAEHGGGARALFGVARAALRGDDDAAKRAALEAVLEASPHHGEAMVALATLEVDAGNMEAGLRLANRALGVEEVDGERLRTAPSARGAGWALLGRVQERRGRTTQALEAYERALEVDSAQVPALLGAGRVLLGDRPADALARFESVLEAEAGATLMLDTGRTAHQEAQLGAARAMIVLGRVQEAKATLEPLVAVRADDAEVLLWLGRAEQALDPPNYAAAEQHYRAAIQSAEESLPAYLALAHLFLATERGSDAGAVLEQAAARVPESADMRYQLGAFELQRNRLPAAIRELQNALELDPAHPPALYSLGVTQRMSGQLEAAEQTFARLAEADSGYPGLALERGRLFEARGESERAVEAYRAALEEQPDNMDLLLRLGAAQVAAGQIDEAEVTLDRVRAERPNSPEAHHFVGRVAFARGLYTEALSHFRQAVRLDPSRAEFHLYEGWAAFESDQLADALRGVEEALEREPNLGEALWIRGEIKLRSGQPRDALVDLLRARELSPGRHAVLAAMGEVYDQLRQLDAAIDAYQQAVARDDDNGRWWYRLGRLRMDAGRTAEAGQALARATLFGDAESPMPGWLADAHRLQGDAARLQGQRGDAIQHYRRYLEIAPPGAIDRGEVRSTLMDMGEVPPSD